jgi:nitrite reductase (NADH) large subunit
VKVVVVGNGVAGTLAAKGLRDRDPGIGIVLFAAERHPYYPRPNLIEYIAGAMPREKLFAFPPAWYADRKIDLRLATPVRAILPESWEVETADGAREPYDRLLLADGASASIPPIRGAGARGVFTVRTLDDADALLESLRTHPRVAVVGGGLLGLEVARGLRSRGADVEVIEFFPYLLPRQLDPPGAAVLKTLFEARGIRVRVGVVTQEVLGGDEARGLRFQDGTELAADMVVVAAGIRPNTGLAKSAGLTVDRGVVVDDRMGTSRPGIFAAGDGAEHKGRIYGIIPAAFDQARIAAANILGRPEVYKGTIPSNTLQVAGLALTAVGLVNPEGPGFEEIRKADPDKGLYKKIVLKDGVLVGAIWLGTKAGVAEVSRAVLAGKDVGGRKNAILEAGFDFSTL